MDQVESHLNDYLSRSCHVLSGNQADVDDDLYLLIIQCFEVCSLVLFSGLYIHIPKTVMKFFKILFQHFYYLFSLLLQLQCMYCVASITNL